MSEKNERTSQAELNELFSRFKNWIENSFFNFILFLNSLFDLNPTGEIPQH